MSAVSQYLVLNKRNYFAIADEYIQLSELFRSDTLYEKLSLFMKLIGNLALSILWKSQLLSILFTVYRMIQDWLQYIRYLELKHQIHEWRDIIHSIGGPCISTNDETYKPYVYAHTMQVLHNQLFGLTKKGAKCLK